MVVKKIKILHKDEKEKKAVEENTTKERKMKEKSLAENS